MMCGHESHAALKEMLHKVDMIECINNLEGTMINIQGRLYRLRNFLCGDHMLLCKMMGKDGPGSKSVDRFPCPMCSPLAPQIRSYKAQSSYHLLMVHRCSKSQQIRWHQIVHTVL